MLALVILLNIFPTPLAVEHTHYIATTVYDGISGIQTETVQTSRIRCGLMCLLRGTNCTYFEYSTLGECVITSVPLLGISNVSYINFGSAKTVFARIEGKEMGIGCTMFPSH